MPFKLTELFVEIAANDAPFTATLDKLKTKAITTADSIGRSMGEKIFTGIANQVPILGKAFEKIKDYFGVTNADIFDMAFAKLEENLPQITDSLSKLAESTFPGLQDSVLNYADSLAKAFGSDMFSAVDDLDAAFVKIRTTITDLQADVQAVIGESWPELMQIAQISATTLFENIQIGIMSVWNNWREWGAYIANNWSKLIIDGVNLVMTSLHNMGDYLGRLGYQIVEFFKNPTKGFKAPEWEGLLEGFKATADKIPETLIPKFKDATAEMAPLWDSIFEKRRARLAIGALPSIEEFKGVPAATAAAAAAAGGKFTSQTMGVADFATTLRESILSQKSAQEAEKADAKEAKAAAKETAKNTKKLADALDKPQPAKAG